MREKLDCGGELTVEESCLQRRLTAGEVDCGGEL